MRFNTLLTLVAIAVASVRGAPTVGAVRGRDLDLGVSLNIISQLFNGADLSQSNSYGAPIPPWEPGCTPGWYYGSNPEEHPDLPGLGGGICQILSFIPDMIQCPISPSPSSSATTEVATPTTTPATDSATSPATSPATDPATDSATSPATSPATDPATSPSSTPATSPATSPATTSVAAPTTTSAATPATTSTASPTTSSSSPTASPSDPTPSDGYTQTFSNMDGATQAGDYMTFGLVDTVAECKAMCDAVKGCNFVNTYHDVNGKDGSPLLTCSLFTNCHGPEDSINKGGQTEPDGSVNYITDSDGWCKN